MDRKTVEQLVAELSLPERIDSLEMARELARPLVAANDGFNSIHFYATTPRYPDHVVEPYGPGEEELRSEHLAHVHSLQAQALVWHLADLMEREPEVQGFSYSQVDCKKSKNRHLSTVEKIIMAPRLGSETVNLHGPQAIEELLNSLPDLIAFHGRDMRWERPAPNDERPFVEALMDSARHALGEKNYARWEALLLRDSARAAPQAKAAPRI